MIPIQTEKCILLYIIGDEANKRTQFPQKGICHLTYPPLLLNFILFFKISSFAILGFSHGIIVNSNFNKWSPQAKHALISVLQAFPKLQTMMIVHQNNCTASILIQIFDSSFHQTDNKVSCVPKFEQQSNSHFQINIIKLTLEIRTLKA